MAFANRNALRTGEGCDIHHGVDLEHRCGVGLPQSVRITVGIKQKYGTPGDGSTLMTVEGVGAGRSVCRRAHGGEAAAAVVVVSGGRGRVTTPSPRTSLPSASVLTTSTVRPEKPVWTSSGRVDSGPTEFSAMHITQCSGRPPVTPPRCTTACQAASTAAAPPVWDLGLGWLVGCDTPTSPTFSTIVLLASYTSG